MVAMVAVVAMAVLAAFCSAQSIEKNVTKGKYCLARRSSQVESVISHKVWHEEVLVPAAK